MNLNDQIKAVSREIAMRKSVYPRRIEIGKMKPETAEHEIAAMEAVYATLKDRQNELAAKVTPKS